MARSFSEDGAAGAGNSLDNAPAPGASAAPAPAISGATTMPAGGQLNSFDDWMQYGGGTSGDLTGDSGGSHGGGSSTAQNGAPWAPQPTGLGRQDTSGITPWGRQFTQNTGSTQMQFGGFYAEGGAIPDESEDPNQMSQGPANGLAAMIQKATASVQEVLAYGRQKHGIGGGGGADEGAIKEAGARMPSMPGNPSESGVRPPQPMPGPLPPTSNPFGKRAEAQPQDDQGAGAIDDTEEEMA